ncbi:MAG: hypothetical protein LBI53_03270 [Candidatus Peribacteria bacterium]|nr:hypothetical protein [Candidatus Peribacteria bacterium]
MLVDVDPQIQRARLKERGHTEEQIETRINGQYSTPLKQEVLESRISADEYGNIVHLQNNGDNSAEIESKFIEMLSVVDIFGELRMKSIFAELGIEHKFQEIYSNLKSQYDSPSRLYHDWSHIVACMNKLYNIKHEIANEDFIVLFLSLLFHDVIYDTSNAS